MALTEAQIVDLSKLIGETYPATRSALPVVTAVIDAAAVAAIEAELIGLITQYTTVEHKHIRLSGGSDGIDLNYERNRLDLQVKARRLLGLSPLPAGQSSSDPNAIQFFTYRGPSWA